MNAIQYNKSICKHLISDTVPKHLHQTEESNNAAPTITF